MNDLLDWAGKTPEELKEILKLWAYNEDLYLLEQDEDLLFHDIKWTMAVLPFMFDESCVKREYIIGNFLDYIRELFLYQTTNEIIQIEKEIMMDMVVHHSHTNDYVIGDCIDYFYTCLSVLQQPRKPDLEYVNATAGLLLNGKNNFAKIDQPIITDSGNYLVKCISSTTSFLCFDKDTGAYKYNKFYPLCK